MTITKFRGQKERSVDCVTLWVPLITACCDMVRRRVCGGGGGGVQRRAAWHPLTAVTPLSFVTAVIGVYYIRNYTNNDVEAYKEYINLRKHLQIILKFVNKSTLASLFANIYIATN